MIFGFRGFETKNAVQLEILFLALIVVPLLIREATSSNALALDLLLLIVVLSAYFGKIPIGHLLAIALPFGKSLAIFAPTGFNVTFSMLVASVLVARFLFSSDWLKRIKFPPILFVSAWAIANIGFVVLQSLVLEIPLTAFYSQLRYQVVAGLFLLSGVIFASFLRPIDWIRLTSRLSTSTSISLSFFLIWSSFPPEIQSFLALQIRASRYLFPMSGNHLAYYTLIVVAIVFIFLKGRNQALLLIGPTIALGLTGTRSAWIALLTLFVVVAALGIKRRSGIRAIFHSISVSLISFFFAQVLTLLSPVRSLFDRLSTASNQARRDLLAESATELNLIGDRQRPWNFWIGRGAGQFEIDPHNFYLSNAIELGLLGFCLVATIFIPAVTAFLRPSLNTGPDWRFLFVAIFVIFLFTNDWMSPFFQFFIGATLATSMRPKQSLQRQPWL